MKWALLPYLHLDIWLIDGAINRWGCLSCKNRVYSAFSDCPGLIDNTYWLAGIIKRHIKFMIIMQVYCNICIVMMCHWFWPITVDLLTQLFWNYFQLVSECVFFIFHFRMIVKKLPQILALHLKRFKYVEQQQRYTKLSYRVAFPLQLRLINTVSRIFETQFESCPNFKVLEWFFLSGSESELVNDLLIKHVLQS